jgi:hypothetical protein
LCDFAQTARRAGARLGSSEVTTAPKAHTWRIKMKNARIDRMLRELHAGPPLRFLEDIFSVSEIVSKQMNAIREASRDEKSASLGAPALAR